MRFFKAASKASRKGRIGGIDWDAADRGYSTHLASIRDRLPPDALELDRINLHDSEIVKVERLTKKSLRILVRPSSWSEMESGALIALTFTGTERTWIPESIAGSTWVREELDLSIDGLFVLRVLLAEGEITVTAKGLQLEPLRSR